MGTINPARERKNGALLTPDETEIREQLQAILNSPGFLSSKKLSGFLSYVVENTLDGNAGRIKQYCIGVDVYGRQGNFDPKSDPLVRIEAGRLRRSLENYYETRGKHDPIRIDIPRGTYVPDFQRNPTATLTSNDHPAGDQPAAALEVPVVAVFPFVNDAGEDYRHFANGLAIELVDDLSRCPDIHVYAYYATAGFDHQSDDIAVVADSLGVDFAITGSLRYVDSLLRTTVQLVDLASNRQIWSDRYEIDIRNSSLGEVEDSILLQVLGQIADQHGIIMREMSRRVSAPPTGPSVYEAVLLGHNYQLEMSMDAYRKARSALEKAVEIDPECATAWALLSFIYLDAVVFEIDAIPDAKHLGSRCAAVAVNRDPGNQMAHSARAFVGLLERDREAIIRSASQMISINDRAASMVAVAGFWLCIAGEYEEGMHWLERGISLGPNHASWLHAAGFFYAMHQQDLEAALGHATDFGLVDFFWSPIMKAAVLGLMGYADEAHTNYIALLRLKPDFANRPDYYIRSFVFEDALADRILQGLELAGLQGSAEVARLVRKPE